MDLTAGPSDRTRVYRCPVEERVQALVSQRPSEVGLEEDLLGLWEDEADRKA